MSGIRDYITCDFCRKPLDPFENGVYRRVVGWVQNRSKGGANQVVLASEPQGWAHKGCMEEEKLRVSKGWAKDHPSLF